MTAMHAGSPGPEATCARAPWRSWKHAAVVGWLGLVTMGRAAPAFADPTRRVTEPAAAAAASTEMSAAEASPPVPTLEPARLGDGSKITLPPMTIPLDRPTPDRRPMLVGAGLIVLALLFWWNRRRRDLFEREDRGASAPGAPVRPTPRDRDTDDDADDLHAAARGEEPDAPDTQRTPDRQDP